MNFRTFLLLDVLVLFLAYTVYVIASVGYAGFFREALASPVGIQLVADLVIALSLALVWMWRDAKTSGVPFAPWAAVTLVLGSVGPLGFLLHRAWKARQPSAARRAVPA
ncbi:MAG: DUF2834 domain-containing protein [Proteobacteria bacterium]|nr:MAG: DUF2834 domain-containing protein [Pseudomonadota bacterium]